MLLHGFVHSRIAANCQTGLGVWFGLVWVEFGFVWVLGVEFGVGTGVWVWVRLACFWFRLGLVLGLVLLGLVLGVRFWV